MNQDAADLVQAAKQGPSEWRVLLAIAMLEDNDIPSLQTAIRRGVTPAGAQLVTGPSIGILSSVIVSGDLDKHAFAKRCALAMVGGLSAITNPSMPVQPAAKAALDAARPTEPGAPKLNPGSTVAEYGAMISDIAEVVGPIAMLSARTRIIGAIVTAAGMGAKYFSQSSSHSGGGKQLPSGSSGSPPTVKASTTSGGDEGFTPAAKIDPSEFK